MRTIIIGAGRVGLGALGVALSSQGHEVVFAARRDEIVSLLEQLQPNDAMRDPRILRG